MFCEKCGKEITKKTRYCQYCGAQQRSAHLRKHGKKKISFIIMLIFVLTIIVVIPTTYVTMKPIPCKIVRDSSLGEGKTAYFFSRNGNVIKMEEYAKSGELLFRQEYSYDEKNNLICNEVFYEEDDNLVTSDSPSQKMISEYDKDGKLIKVDVTTNDDRLVFEFQYDEKGNLKYANLGGEPTYIECQYNTKGKIEKAFLKMAHSEQEYKYNKDERLEEAITKWGDGRSFKISYSQDEKIDYLQTSTTGLKCPLKYDRYGNLVAIEWGSDSSITSFQYEYYSKNLLDVFQCNQAYCNIYDFLIGTEVFRVFDFTMYIYNPNHLDYGFMELFNKAF